MVRWGPEIAQTLYFHLPTLREGPVSTPVQRPFDVPAWLSSSGDHLIRDSRGGGTKGGERARRVVGYRAVGPVHPGVQCVPCPLCGAHLLGQCWRVTGHGGGRASTKGSGGIP